jgi:hypothetical protein
LGAGHALSFLITRWSKAAAVKLECVKVRRLPYGNRRRSFVELAQIFVFVGGLTGNCITYPSHSQEG